VSNDADMRKWLFHAAYCKAASNLRHRRVIAWEALDTALPPQPMEWGGSRFENSVADAEEVRTALAELEPGDAACLTLGVVQGFTSVEIAHILDITPEAARKRLSRALQRLRRLFRA
jgi:RNA polymerase sigma factor (sigma-70 family)